MDPVLVETLRQAQRFGFFGPGDIDEAISHSCGFVSALGEVGVGTRIVDLGSGGGLPGLVVAEAFRSASVVLVDRRQKRADFLELAVTRLGWDHVAVRCVDASEMVADVASGREPPFDIACARGFGPPEPTLRLAWSLCRPAGCVAISEPPSGDRWDPRLLDELGLSSFRSGPVRVFRSL